MATGNKLKCSIRVEGRRYYNADSDFGIIVATPLKVNEGTPIVDDSGYFIAKGKMPEPRVGGQYMLTATEIDDPKWGKQYQIVNMCTSIALNMDDKEGQRIYLETIFTPNQVFEMYQALENPYQIFVEEDLQALLTVKGCGFKTASKWMAKFKRHIEYSRIYVELDEYDLSAAIIKKLIEYYGSADLVIQTVKKNPYCLIDIQGIGWKTCDELALKGGMGIYCAERVEAFIKYYLRQKAEEGYTYVYSNSQLMDSIIYSLGENIPDEPISMAVKHLGDKLWWSDDKEKIGLKHYINLEKKIADKLIEIRNAPNKFEYQHWKAVVKQQEEEQGWEYTEQQMEGLQAVLENNVVTITGYAGCVDCDTEYFNGAEWKRISDYDKSDKVLQYNADGTSELVKPYAYIKNPQDKLYHFATKYGLDQCLSANHECYYITSKGNLYHKPFEQIMNDQINGTGFHGKFITTFDYQGEGINLTDELLRLQTAICADGSYYYHLSESASAYTKVHMHLKKHRKKNRLRKLLVEANIQYVEKESTAKGYSDFYFDIGTRIKHFPKEWYKANKHQQKVIAEEILMWDGGSEQRPEYYTTCKNDADFIQFIFTSLGYRSSITMDDRYDKSYHTSNKEYVRKSISYIVRRTSRTKISMTHYKRDNHENTKIEEYKTKDGFEYCFNIPSHMLVLRRNNKIFITGNCGKSSIVSGILKILDKYTFAQCALAGRAAARLAEVTKQEGFTIHRLLGFPMGDNEHAGFAFHEENPLDYDIIIVDEISMVDGTLFYRLINAIQPGTKLVLLGDIGQLESIGCSNIAHDLIESPEIVSIQLSKIHRQAAASAIITDSLLVRTNQQVIERDFVGTVTKGELSDLTYDCYSDIGNTFYKILQHFQKYMSQTNNILDVQVIVPRKDQDAGTWNLNSSIQELFNPQDDNKAELLVHYDSSHTGYLRLGDKVMNINNNYKTVAYAGQWDVDKEEAESMGMTTPVYNGNIGVITKINKYRYEIVVDFVDIGEILITKDDLRSIMLGYACTVHKCQGSQFPYVIFGMDFSSYALLTKELIYTAITRASEHCTVVAQTSAFRYAVAQNGVSIKQTVLQEKLIERARPKMLI